MREKEKLEFRSTRPVSAGSYKWCDACRTRVTMPCVACAARSFQQSRKLNNHAEATHAN